MKKTFTIIAILLFNIQLIAQISPSQVISGPKEAKINNNIIMSGEEALGHLMTNPNPTTSNNKFISPAGEEQIGITWYDLQTNATVMDRIIRHTDGTISATWTMSQNQDPYVDRGTGYNYYGGSSWDFPPGTRIESSRCGWPSLGVTSNGKEIVMAHNTDNGYVQMTHRGTVGSGGWQEQVVSSVDSLGVYRDLVWNRTAIGGNGETIHMVAVTSPTGLSGTPYNGLDGALLYYRSSDGGDTWEVQDLQLPTLDTSMFVGFGGDSYTIKAQGDIVVLAHFGGWEDSFIMKSTDNGDTWTKTIFLDFPVDRYSPDDGLDLDSDGSMDSLFSTDGSGALLIDNNGDAHVFAGNMRLLDADLGDGQTSYFPGTNGLLYWNESMGADTTGQVNNSIWESTNMEIIAFADDLDGDSLLSLDASIARYFLSLSSMPSVGMDDNGHIYLSYSAVVETASNGTQNYRHVYIIKSEDNGDTWSTPVDVTPHDVWGGAQECVYASMYEIIDEEIHLVYQKDATPGLVVKENDPINVSDENQIIYLKVNADLTLNTEEHHINSESKNTLFPNPAQHITSLTINSETNETISIKITDLIGKVVYSDIRNISAGINYESLNISNLNTGVYFVNTEINNNIISNKLVITK